MVVQKQQRIKESNEYIKLIELSKQQYKLQTDDIQHLKNIGNDTLDKVQLVYITSLKGKYVLKNYHKDLINQSYQKLELTKESEILDSINHPFIISKTIAQLEDEEYQTLFEYQDGINIKHFLFLYRRMTEYQAKFFSAQIVLALEYLHQKKIIYSNLSKKNIVLNYEGYIRLIDFKKCKRVEEQEDLKVYSQEIIEDTAGLNANYTYDL